MNWKNYGLIKAKNLDVDTFTSDFGIKLRKIAYPMLNFIIKKNQDKEVKIVAYPNLQDDKAYIFAAGHSFPGEIASNLYAIDRNAYTLIGTTDQVDHNPQMYFLWINGLIYVNKLDTDSRKESYKKMVRVLNQNTSVLMFPEGVLNNSENLNCMPLYPGVYHLALETNKKVVPIVSNYDYENQVILIAADDPMDFNGLSKKQALVKLRDNLATLRFNLSRMSLEQVNNISVPLLPSEFSKLNPTFNVELLRSTLEGDIHQQYMDYRKKIYQEVKWTCGDAFEEEIMTYKDKNVSEFNDVFSFVENINLSQKNEEVREMLNPILQRIKDDKKYDIKEYMKKNWNK